MKVLLTFRVKATNTKITHVLNLDSRDSDFYLIEY